MTTTADSTQSSRRYRRLRVANVAVGAFLAAEAAHARAQQRPLAAGLRCPTSTVTRSRRRAPPPAEQLFTIPIGPAVAVFLVLAAIDHLVVAAPRVHRWYEQNLDAGANYARWIEYSISASIMIVLIAMFVGIRDIAALARDLRGEHRDDPVRAADGAPARARRSRLERVLVRLARGCGAVDRDPRSTSSADQFGRPASSTRSPSSS